MPKYPRFDNDIEWERVMGRRVQTAAKVPLGLTVEQGTLRVVLEVGNINGYYHRDKAIPAKLIQQLLGFAKPPKAKRQPPVKLASLPDGQRAEYDRVMAQVAA